MAVTLEQFVERLEASGLMSAGEVSAVTGALPDDRRPSDVPSLARLLVHQGKLTKYQAAAVYQRQTDHLVLGDYVVLDKLGEGGMGQVLKARHRRMDRIVALKILPAAKVDSKAAIERFHQEVRAAAKLNHPNIVTAYDAGEQDGIHYLVMEYVDGQDLSSLVKEQGQLPVEQAVDYIIQAARGLAYAHDQGVVHRDIKPGNLLVAVSDQSSSIGSKSAIRNSQSEIVKILDMGLARLTSGDLNKAGGEGEGLTQSGQVMGTVDYMAPEQALDTRRADERADIYALGCTLYRLLTGETPFAGDTMMMKLLAHREQPVPSLREFRPDVSPALDAVYQRMMAKNAEDRQQSMAEVVEELQSALAGPVAPPPAPSRPAAAPAPPRRSEEPSADSALASFLQTTAKPTTATAKKKEKGSTSAFEETIDRSSSDEGTGDRLEDVQPLVESSPIEAAQRQRSRPDANKHRSATKPWLIPAIAGGGLLAVLLIGFVLYLVFFTSDDVQLGDNGQSASSSDSLRDDAIPPPLSNANNPAQVSQPSSGGIPSAVTSNQTLPPPDYGPGAPPLAKAPFNEEKAKDYQDRWAEFLNLPVEKEVELPGGEKMAFRLIPPGEFLMGSTPDEQTRFLEEAKAANGKSGAIAQISLEGPQHLVRITRPFYLGKYEVTQAQWQGEMGNNPSAFKANTANPVEQISWNDIQPFVAKLNSGAEGTRFKLPTEAQWEHACRAGSTTPWHCGDEAGLLLHGWFVANSEGETHPVGQLRANGFGLHDMHGNVWERCSDKVSPGKYSNTTESDPIRENGIAQVMRGGGWGYQSGQCRSAQRFFGQRDDHSSAIGFRLAMTIPDSVWRDKAQIAGGWTHLFNGADLTGWEPVGDPALWTVSDGVLQTTGAETGWLSTVQEYDDFALQFEYRLPAKGTSGVFLRAPRIGAHNHSAFVEVELIDDATANKNSKYLTGSLRQIAERKAADVAHPASSGEWNVMEIRAVGPEIRVTLNGQKINDVHLGGSSIPDFMQTNAERPSGCIGLQCANSSAEFRNIRIRPIRPQPIADAAGPAVDVLQQIKVARDALDGQWVRTGEVIEVPHLDESTMLNLPVSVDPSFRLEMEVVNIAGSMHPLAIAFPVADTAAVVNLDGFGTTHTAGLSGIDGKNPLDNESRIDGLPFRPFQPSTIVLTVRPNWVHLVWDGKEIVNWTEVDRLKYKYAIPNQIQVGAYRGGFRFSKIEYTPLEAANRDSTSQPDEVTSMHDWIDVIPLIDPAQDRFDLAQLGKNDWRVERGELKYTSDGKPGKILFPLIIGGPSLEWEIEFTRDGNDGSFNTDVPASGGILPVMFDPPVGPLQDKVGIGAGVNIYSAPWTCESGRKTKARIRVERIGAEDHVEVFVDDKSVLTWAGDRESIVKPPAKNEFYSTAERLGLYVHPGDFTFHRIRLRMLQGGTLKLLRPEDASKVKPAERASSKPITPADEWVDILPLADTSRDVVDGDWKSAGDAMQVTGSKESLARLMLPVVPKGSYAVELGFTRTKGSEDVAVLLPVADRSVVYVTSAFGRYSGINVIGGAKIHESGNPTRQPTQVVTGTPIKVQVAVILLDETNVRFVIQSGTAERVDVTVPIADLDKGAKWKWHDGLTDTSRLGLGAEEVDATIEYVKLKMLPDSEAQVLAEDRRSVRIEQGTPAESQPSDTDDNQSWITLFNGRDLTGWEVIGDAKLWGVSRGTLVTNGAGVGWLSTDKEFSNFVLQFEFQLPANGNSGVFLRVPRTGAINGGEFLEIALQDDAAPRATKNFTGSAYNIAERKIADAMHPAGSGNWNQMEIRAVGREIQVALNGKLVNQFDLGNIRIPAPMAANAVRPSGYIGLQCNRTGAVFRNIRIRPAE